MSFLPCRGAGSNSSDTAAGDQENIGEESTPEHRRLQRTPTPYYEEAPPLMAATETVDVDDMQTPDENSMTDVSGTSEGSSGTTQKTADFCYEDDNDDEDDDDADICRELAQLN